MLKYCLLHTYSRRADDWRNPNGEIIPPPTTDAESLFSSAYSYCVENWCISDASNSLFTYGSYESFSEISKCGVPFSSEVEDAVLNIVENPSINQDLSDVCGDSLVCLVDGVCGGIADAADAKTNQQVIVEKQVEVLANIFPIEIVDILDVIVVTDVENTDEPNAPTAPNAPAAPNAPTAKKETTQDQFWYPAWDNGFSENVCLNDGNASPHMKKTGELPHTSSIVSSVIFFSASHFGLQDCSLKLPVKVRLLIDNIEHPSH